MRAISLSVIRLYQNYISKFTPKSCRYYPTCSEYALHSFKHNSFFIAIFCTFFRILRCNQLFKGGIDYPIVYKKFNSFSVFSSVQAKNISFWFVPYKNNKFYIIKSFT